MKGTVLKLVLIGLLGGVLMAGCETDHHEVVVTPGGQIVVPHRPPAERHEVAGRPTIAGEVWIPGYWTYAENRWVWIRGRWQPPPPNGFVWRPGHWRSETRGWVWTPGHWE